MLTDLVYEQLQPQRKEISNVLSKLLSNVGQIYPFTASF